MTKKDYELIAFEFKREINHCQRQRSDAFVISASAICGMAVALAERFLLQDRRFKKDLFLEQCGVYPERKASDITE